MTDPVPDTDDLCPGDVVTGMVAAFYADSVGMLGW
jgi:hypothetical protein